MDIAKSFTYVFDDEEWIMKLGIGGLVMLVPFVNFAGIGYMIQVIRNVKAGQERPLPAWDNFGQYFIDGLKVVLAVFIYMLPAFCILFAAVAASIGLTEVVGSSDDIEAVAAIIILCGNCLMIVLLFVPLFFFTAGMILYAETGEMGAFFRIGQIFDFIRRDVGGYFILILISFIASGFIAQLGAIVCIIGFFWTQWWAYLISSHLAGQLAAKNAI